MATRGLVGPQNYPLFFRPENDGDQGPIVFRWFLAPDSHGKSPHWSPPVLRLAAAIAAPLARSRSAFAFRWHTYAQCALKHSRAQDLSPDPRSSIEPSREGACPWSYTTRIVAPASPS